MCRTLCRVAGMTPSPPRAGSVVVALRVVGLRAGRSRRVVDRVDLVAQAADRADLVVALVVPAVLVDREVAAQAV